MQVLIAEDDPISRRVLSTTLEKWGYEVLVTCDGNETWEIIKLDDSPPLAILDWSMPGMTGVEICEKLRKRRREKYVYVILLTVRGQKEDLIKGMQAGADDYIIKPFDTGELKVRLRAAKRILDLQSDLIAAQKILRQRATHDALTGLWNRAGIIGILQRELERARREDKPLTVILSDIDYFKRVNDTYGHRAGDDVLKEVAERMNAVVRPYDLVGRYGGEEFLSIVPGCETTFAAYVAERVRNAIAEKPFSADGNKVTVTMSLGVVSVRNAEASQTDEIIQLADETLYEAKNSGRNRVEVSRTQLALAC